MLDSHINLYTQNWGILPSFEIFGITINSYSFCVILGLIVGITVFFLLGEKKFKNNNNKFRIIFAGICGGTLGAKIPIWIAYFNEIKQSGSLEIILAGRTITGGLIGGFFAVLITKKILKEKTRFGNAIAPGAAIGIAIGRIGCFLEGCCVGKETSLKWGVDFGDGISRHPTQIYESIFLVILFIFFLKILNTKPKDGLLFDIFLIFYFSFRFLIEFIRIEPKIILGFSLYQIASIVVIIFTICKMIISNKKFNYCK